MGKFWGSISGTLVMLLCAGCSSNVDFEPSSTVIPTVGSDVASHGIDALFEEGGPYLSDFVQRNPEYSNEFIEGPVLLETEATGPSVFEVPLGDESVGAITVSLICFDDSKYAVDVLIDGDEFDRTWADSCRDGSLIFYTSRPIVGEPSRVQVDVSVNEGVRFRISVFAYDES